MNEDELLLTSSATISNPRLKRFLYYTDSNITISESWENYILLFVFVLLIVSLVLLIYNYNVPIHI